MLNLSIHIIYAIAHLAKPSDGFTILFPYVHLFISFQEYLREQIEVSMKVSFYLLNLCDAETVSLLGTW